MQQWVNPRPQKATEKKMLKKGRGGLCKAQQRKKEESKRLRGEREREIRSISFTLDLKGGRLKDSGEQEEGKTFYKLNFLGMLLKSHGGSNSWEWVELLVVLVDLRG